MDSTREKQQRFMNLYGPLHARLCRFVQTLTRDPEEAKDLVSEAILIAYENMERIRNEEAMPAYLFSVASNLVNKKLRRRKFLGFFDQGAAHNMPGSQRSDSSLMLYELNLALQQLPRKQREALSWYEIGGLSIEEIASLHRTSAEGVRTSIHRARKNLAEKLERNTQLPGKQKGVWYEG